MKLLPFDLQRALAGDRVVTRNGLVVVEIKLLDTNIHDKVIFLLEDNGYIYQCDISGMRNSVTKNGHPLDLFMVEEETLKIEIDIICHFKFPSNNWD